jgi:hypothetical protein
MQDSHFTIGTLSVYVVLESIEYLFEGVLFACGAVGYFPNVSVCSTAEEVLYFE